jgi:hypothetical protein
VHLAAFPPKESIDYLIQRFKQTIFDYAEGPEAISLFVGPLPTLTGRLGGEEARPAPGDACDGPSPGCGLFSLQRHLFDHSSTGAFSRAAIRHSRRRQGSRSPIGHPAIQQSQGVMVIQCVTAGGRYKFLSLQIKLTALVNASVAGHAIDQPPASGPARLVQELATLR